MRVYVRIRPTCFILPATVAARLDQDSPNDLSVTLSGGPATGSPRDDGPGRSAGGEHPGPGRLMRPVRSWSCQLKCFQGFYEASWNLGTQQHEGHVRSIPFAPVKASILSRIPQRGRPSILGGRARSRRRAARYGAQAKARRHSRGAAAAGRSRPSTKLGGRARTSLGKSSRESCGQRSQRRRRDDARRSRSRPSASTRDDGRADLPR